MVRTQEKLGTFQTLVDPLHQEYLHGIPALLSSTKTAGSGPALSAKEKEVISAARSVDVQCEGCIASHLTAAAPLEASREETTEAGFVAVVRHGGPASTYLRPGIDAVNDFVPGPVPLASA